MNEYYGGTFPIAPGESLWIDETDCKLWWKKTHSQDVRTAEQSRMNEDSWNPTRSVRLNYWD